MARRHIIVTTLDDRPNLLLGRNRRNCRADGGGKKTLKRGFSCGYTADISIWQGSLWLLCKPSPNREAHGRHIHTFFLLLLLLDPPSTSSVYPPPVSIANFLPTVSLSSVTARQPPPPLCAAPSFLFSFPSLFYLDASHKK